MARQRTRTTSVVDGRLFFQEGDAVEGIGCCPSRAARRTFVTCATFAVLWSVEKAAIGVLISLQEPTGPMQTEASEASFYPSKWGTFLRIQLLTIKGLLDKTQRLQYSPTNVTFKRLQKRNTISP